ncbi:MAG: UvrD-helicase domain-containing protein, partial [Desulfatitalea sp.]
MKEFALADAPLEGVHLIEAGAGTGKTYTIAGIFLRLIVEKGVPIDQILVVTYTEAATEELKTRIRQRLLTARIELAKDGIEDRLVADMVTRVVEPHVALQRIRDALIDFDRAAIFTIHGFCQRVLSYFAFETGHLFEAELTQDAQPMIQEVADDYWRRYISRAPVELVQTALDRLKGPEELAALFYRRRLPQVRVIPPAVKPPLSAIGTWRRAARQVRAEWPAVRDAVVRLLAEEGLNATKYGKCVPDPAHPADPSPRQRFVSALVAAMDRWQGTYPLFKHFERFGRSYLVKATKKGYSPPSHPFFELCDHALACQNDMAAQLEAYVRYLKVRLLAQFHLRLAEKKARDNTLFFDDLLLQVHAALQSERRHGLVQAIQQQFQAALVDEFQDTDALQYDIFATLFATGGALFFMIGDPKQAIYSFRGADLFSYLHAKDKAPHRYTLTRNWRATPALIRALNALFAHRARPFGYQQIPYER